MIKTYKKTVQWVLLIFFIFSISVYGIDNNRVWKSIGPDGGSVRTLAISRSDPNIVYALAGNYVGQLLFKSVDGGVEWEFVQHDNSESYSLFGDLLVDPDNSQILFFLGSKNIIFRSKDGGISWNEIKLKEGRLNSSFIALNTPLSESLRAVIDLKNGGSSIALSHDGGESWEVSKTVIRPKVGVVGIDPKNPQIIYGISEKVLHKSIDGGKTWSSIQPAEGLKTYSIYFKLQIHPVNSNILYGRFHDENEDALFKLPTYVWLRSNDGGENWNFLGELGESFEIKELTVDDNLSNILYATVHSDEVRTTFSHGFGFSNINAEIVVAKSINSGKNWELINLGVTAETNPEDRNRIVLNSKDNRKVLLNSQEGVVRSQNGGLDWQSSNRGLNSIGGTVRTTPDNTDVVHLVHNNLRHYKTINGGESWKRISKPRSIGCSFDSSVIFNPKNNQEALCSQSGKIYKSSDGGVNWFLFLDNEGKEINSNNSNLCYSNDGRKIYFSNDKGFISVENNETQNVSIMEWTQSIGISFEDIVVDPIHSLVIFAVGKEDNSTCACRSTSVYKSEDGGVSWQKKIGAIHGGYKLLIHPFFSEGLIFIDGSTASITGDGGNSWEELDYQAIGKSIYSFVFNPRNKDGFFIRTDKGIFETKDLGQNFNQVEMGVDNINEDLKLFGDGEEVYLASPSQLYKLTTSAISNETKNCVFNWAEQQYPALFGLTIGESSQNEQYTYRYYSDTQTYLGFFQDKKVHYLNASQSDNIEDVGYIEYYQHLAGCD